MIHFYHLVSSYEFHTQERKEAFARGRGFIKWLSDGAYDHKCENDGLPLSISRCGWLLIGYLCGNIECNNNMMMLGILMDIEVKCAWTQMLMWAKLLCGGGGGNNYFYLERESNDDGMLTQTTSFFFFCNLLFSWYCNLMQTSLEENIRNNFHNSHNNQRERETRDNKFFMDRILTEKKAKLRGRALNNVMSKGDGSLQWSDAVDAGRWG